MVSSHYLALIRSSDHSESQNFTDLYSKHEKEIFLHIVAMLGGRGDADEILQLTSIKLWNEFDRYDSLRPFLPWARTIAKFEVLSYWKRRQRDPLNFSQELSEQLIGEWESTFTEEVCTKRKLALDHCMALLSNENRKLLRSRYFGTKTLREVASNNKISPNTVYKSLQRIRFKLSECMKKYLSVKVK